MNPRLKNSKRWTSLPKELLKQIEELFDQNYGNRLKGKTKFIVEGRIYTSELILRTGFVAEGELRQRNFEVSIEFDPNKENAIKQIHLAVDCAASMLEDYLSEDGTEWDDFPKTWQSFKVEGKTAYLQVSAINSALESEADRLLKEKFEGLVEGEDEELEKEAVITMLGLGSESDEDSDETSEDTDGSKKIH